jgi:hypothetical protein
MLPPFPEAAIMPHQTALRRSERFPTLLVAAACGFWIVVFGACVAVLPDRTASADQADRLTWTGD